MDYVWAIILILLNAVWLFAVLFGLPGAWLMVVGTAALAWWQSSGAGDGATPMFGLAVLIAIVVLAALGEIAEFVAGLVGSKRAGGTRWGAVGALVGGIVGAILGTGVVPVFGSLVGACIGAALGAVVLELYSGRRFGESFKSGVGAGAGTFVGRLSKLVVGIAIWIIVAIAVFWP